MSTNPAAATRSTKYKDPGIKHLLIKQGSPQTNSIVESFNCLINDVLASRRYIPSGADTQTLLLVVQSSYSTEGAAPSIAHLSDEEWQAKRQELFAKRMVNHKQPNIYELTRKISSKAGILMHLFINAPTRQPKHFEDSLTTTCLLILSLCDK
ncbi:hypothetical protein RVM27_11395 [Halomonas sp. KM007]|tara:strand:+ start:469 stop:927 length:459 start_codon:yes stop_codon:yes gene_type:complete